PRPVVERRVGEQQELERRLLGLALAQEIAPARDVREQHVLGEIAPAGSAERGERHLVELAVRPEDDALFSLERTLERRPERRVELGESAVGAADIARDILEKARILDRLERAGDARVDRRGVAQVDQRDAAVRAQEKREVTAVIGPRDAL